MNPSRLLALGAFAVAISVGAADLLASTSLPGDAAKLPAPDAETSAAIARGGPGYLAVWQDRRAAIQSIINVADSPLIGNQYDVYGMRLDLAGNPLDAQPIVICNLGRNQTKPKVAWNGQNWLVVFTSERPDWYFFEDIVGVRVSPAGAVLDATPIAIRPEQPTPSNWYGTSPSVGSDGTNWIVVWEDWIPASGFPCISGSRVANDGTVLDPTWPVLHAHNAASFGPRDPQIASANGELLLAWREAVGSQLRARRLATTLQPLAPTFTVASTTPLYRPNLASDGTQYYLLSDLKVFRISSAGTVLDPAGIAIPSAGGAPQVNAAAWNGAAFAVVQNGIPQPTLGNDSDLWLNRVAPNGALVDVNPVMIAGSPDDEWLPAVAGDSGRTQAVYLARGHALEHLEDVRGVNVSPAAVASVASEVAAGRPRQEYATAIETPFGSAVVFTSKSSLTTRVLAQRLDAGGHALDAEPVEIAQTSGTHNLSISGACNGTVLCLAWGEPNAPLFARRYSLDLAPLDAAPVQVFSVAVGAPAVGALGNDFLVTSTQTVSTDQSYVRGARVRGSDGALLDASPLAISGNFAFDPKVVALGSRWLVTWTSKVTHDSPSALIRARFVDASGAMPLPSFLVSTLGFGLDADVAVNGGRALIAWQDNAFATDRIEARLLNADGSFLAGDFVVNDAAGDQLAPTVCASGFDFIATWVDFRATNGIEQPRGDLYAARVTAAGAVLDANGVQLTATATPEDLPDAAASAFSHVVFDGLANSPEVARLEVLRLDGFFASAWQDVGLGKPGAHGTPALAGFGPATAATPFRLQLAGAAPSASAWLIAGFARVDLPFAGGTLVPSPAIVLPLATDPFGNIVIDSTWPAGVPSGFQAWFQAFVADAGATQSIAASNGLQVTAP